MTNTLKRRGQKILRKFSRASLRASEEGREHIRENLFAKISHIRNIKLLILEWSLLVAALIMLSITQAFWFSSSYTNDVFVDGGSYAEATVGRINSMNPLFATTNSEKVLSKLMFATLVTVDYSGNPGLGLAKSLEASENGKVWTITLRDNLRWSDNEPITINDVMFTIETIQNPAVNSIYSSNLEGVRVLDEEDGRITFTLPSAYADFATALEIPIIPKHELDDTPPMMLVEDDFSNKPVTSGAFSFNALQSSSLNDEEVVYLSANPNYYLGRPMLNSFAVHAYSEKAGVIDALNAGRVTATAELSGAEVDKVISRAFIHKESSIDVGAFLFFNTSNGLLKNRDFRAAIRSGLDLPAIRAAAPDTIPLNYPLISSQITLSNYPELPAYDLEAATKKISEYKKDGDINLRIATVNSGFLPAVAEVIKNNLNALGINAETVAYEETQDFVTNVISRRDYDILVYEVELGSDPDPLPYYHSSQITTAGLNLSNYRNALVDDLLVSARETLDEGLRAKKYESFLRYWVDDVPSIALYQANMTYFYNKNARTYGNDVRLVTAIDRFSDVLNFATIKAGRNKTP